MIFEFFKRKEFFLKKKREDFYIKSILEIFPDQISRNFFLTPSFSLKLLALISDKGTPPLFFTSWLEMIQLVGRQIVSKYRELRLFEVQRSTLKTFFQNQPFHKPLRDSSQRPRRRNFFIFHAYWFCENEAQMKISIFAFIIILDPE